MKKRVYDHEKSAANMEKAIQAAMDETGLSREEVIENTLKRFSVKPQKDDYVEITVYLPSDLLALLEAECAKAGITKDQLINNILRAKLTGNNDKVLKPNGKAGLRSMLCTSRDDYFSVMRYITTYNDSAQIDIELPNGNLLTITPETTKAELTAVLRAAFD